MPVLLPPHEPMTDAAIRAYWEAHSPQARRLRQETSARLMIGTATDGGTKAQQQRTKGAKHE